MRRKGCRVLRIWCWLVVLCALAAMLIMGGGLAHGMVSLKGGRTLGIDSPNAARAEVGWPGMKITYVLPILENLDVSPQFGFVYGHNLRADIVGFEPGVEIKWNELILGQNEAYGCQEAF